MPQNKSTLTQLIESIKNLLKVSNGLLGPSIENSIQDDTQTVKEESFEPPKQNERPVGNVPITFAYNKSLKDSPKLDKATQELSKDVLAISRGPEDKPKR